MNRRSFVWLIPALVYMLFFGWYTNLGGPLTPEEIEFFMSRVNARIQDPERRAMMRRFMEEDSGDDFLMTNVLDMRETPDLVGEVQPGETSEQVMGRYMEFMYPELFSRACHPTVFGYAVAPALDLLGIEGADNWSAAAMFRYRSRRDMLEISMNPAFADKHIYKLAALNKTIAYPIETQLNLAEPRVVVGLILLVVAMALHIFTTPRTT